MTHTFADNPRVGQEVVVTTAGNKYVGKVRKTTFRPTTSITLSPHMIIYRKQLWTRPI